MSGRSQNEECVIYFAEGRFESKGLVEAHKKDSDNMITYIVEADFEEYIIWKTEQGWIDTFGNSAGIITIMGEAIDEYFKKKPQVGNNYKLQQE